MAAVSPEHPEPRMTVSRVALGVVTSDMAIRLDCKSRDSIHAQPMLWRIRTLRSSRDARVPHPCVSVSSRTGGMNDHLLFSPRAMSAPRIAAVPALAVIRLREDEIGAVEVIVLRLQVARTRRGLLFRGGRCIVWL